MSVIRVEQGKKPNNDINDYHDGEHLDIEVVGNVEPPYLLNIARDPKGNMPPNPEPDIQRMMVGRELRISWGDINMYIPEGETFRYDLYKVVDVASKDAKKISSGDITRGAGIVPDWTKLLINVVYMSSIYEEGIYE